MLDAILTAERGRPWRGDGDATYGELVHAARAVAAALVDVSPSRHVVLSCRRAESFVPGLLGAWWAGAMVELLPNVGAGTLDRVDGDSAVAHVLHDDVARQARSPKAIHVPSAVAARGADVPAAAPWPAVAVRMTTSGTTEHPKHVTKTPAQLLAELDVLSRVVAPARCVLSTVPLSHLYGLLFGCLVPLRHGARLASHEALLPADVAGVITATGADLLISTPAHLRAMAAATMPRSLRVISSGAHLPAELFLGLAAQHDWRLTEVLGSTETGGIATRTHPGSPWAPLPEVSVSAPEGTMVVESPWCGGAQVAIEDAIELGPDGTFQHLGRASHMIKIAGKRAHAQALEATVRAIPGVRDVAAIVHAPPGREPRVAMAYSVTPGRLVTREQVCDALRRELDPVFVPKVLKILSEIPTTERGKVDGPALRAALGLDDAPPAYHIPLHVLEDGTIAADVPPTLVFFRGHFESFTLLPGAVLLERVVWPAARRFDPQLRALRAIRRLRFKRPVFPGQRLIVSLRGGEPGRVTFEVTSGGAQVATGQLVVE